jgi:5,10-methylenetetrahydrofolate reductase
MGVLDNLYSWSPDFISCTYGAGGTDKGRNFDIIRAIAAAGRAIPVSHYTTIHHTREDIRRDIDQYLSIGVNHFLALRGDFAPGENETHGDFGHATELVEFLKKAYGDRICVSVGSSCEGHILCRSLESDIAFLRRKQDLGADYIVTQLTFDMDQFRRWLDAIRAAGVTMPIVVGVMPVLSRDACIRHCLSMNGCAIPHKLARHISTYYNDPEGFTEAGKEYTVEQIYEYVNCGVNGIHLYTLNKSEAMNDILARTGLFSKE